MPRLIISITLLFFMSSPCVCFGGWFGPKNFEECVLENMKSQDKSLIGMARKTCEKQFPYEKELDLDKENIKISWNNEGGYLGITIEARSADYILTRIDALFSKKNKTEIHDSSDYTLLKTFIFSPEPDIAGAVDEVNDAEIYKAMVVKKAWGIMKKQ